MCEAELVCLDMALNASKSMSIRIGPRHKHNCCELTTLDGHKIQWSNETRYLGVYLISSKIFSISLDNAKKSFYRAFNALFSKVGRVASENVVVELLKTKCFRKIFTVNSNEIVYFCRSMYNCSNIEDILAILLRH